MSISLSNIAIRQLKGIGHHLNPVIIIGNHGISPSVIEETNRALNDHELIKVRIPAGTKQQREQTAQSLASATNATLVQHIGRICLLLRKNPNANPKLSNLIKHG